MSKEALYSSHLSQSMRAIADAKLRILGDDCKAERMAMAIAIAKIRLACDVAGLDYYAIERVSYQLYLASKITEQR